MTFNVPINSTSLGAVSVNFLKEAFRSGDESLVFPISQPDLTIHNRPEGFDEWLNKSINQSIYKHDRNKPTLRLWHISESLFSASKKQILFTFHETSSLTDYEINVLRNQDLVLTPSNYSKDVFESHGVKNVKFCPLGFDADSFKRKDGLYNKKFNPNCITFNVCGKLEKRKAHKQMIQAWCRKYGNHPDYRLQLAVYNQFLNIRNDITGEINDYNNNALADIFERKAPPYNVNVIPKFLPSNDSYNDFLNSGDIILGMSMGESWGLPEFQSVALGKHSVIINAHGYKDWASHENSILVESDGKAPIYDNLFFKRGANVNQGEGFTFNDDRFLDGCEAAIQRYRKSALNAEGLKLQSSFSYKNAFDIIKREMENL